MMLWKGFVARHLAPRPIDSGRPSLHRTAPDPPPRRPIPVAADGEPDAGPPAPIPRVPRPS